MDGRGLNGVNITINMDEANDEGKALSLAFVQGVYARLKHFLVANC